MRRLAFLLVLTVCSASRAELVRVAVASGETLTVHGRALVARTSPDGPPVEVGTTIRLQAVGPFVSDGKQLAASLAISDRTGARIEVGGVRLLGELFVVATAKALHAVDRVDLETYVASVVGGEMPPSWPKAALEAQAVAARSYVLARMRETKERAFDVEASVVSQVYRGAGSLDPRAVAAAEATKGEVLTFHGELATTFFFASCTGRTESAEAAFGMPAPYLVPTSCDGGESAPSARWTRRMRLDALTRSLERAGAIGDALRKVEIESRTSTGRIAKARLVTAHGARTVDGAELRRLIGYETLPSLDAKFETHGGELVVEGSGSGHGVGLCQWCARARALKGDTAPEILARAYPGTELVRR